MPTCMILAYSERIAAVIESITSQDYGPDKLKHALTSSVLSRIALVDDYGYWS